MSGRAGRGVTERVHITGTLVLETPAHFGSGDAEGLTDTPLLRDPLDGKTPLLTGASIAGALRNYVREYEHGYNAGDTRGDQAERLFGRVEGEISVQSWLLVDDALGKTSGTELRDGVAIDPKTRTAEEKKKFDVELLQAGTAFPLSFELLLPGDNTSLLEVLALALYGLEQGEIGLGMRKRRGLGECRVSDWQVRRYNLATPQGLVGWLAEDASDQFVGRATWNPGEQVWHVFDKGRSSTVADQAIFDLLDVSPERPDARESFTIEATFMLESSLLIRSGSGAGDAPDMVHLRSHRSKRSSPILSGTSLAGAVRARALRIANTLLPQGGESLVDEMFGQRIEGRPDQPTGSRVLTRESELEGTRDLVQSRVKIDRFTSGSFPAALFTQQPAFGGDGSSVTLSLTLRQPTRGLAQAEKDAEIGLLLLVLKDLWTGDLPLGGESSVGRGRLSGQHATLTHRRNGRSTVWQLTQQGGRLEFAGDGTRDELEKKVEALHAHRRPDEH